MQYSVHVLPYYPKNADAIVAHYLPYCPTFYTRQRCRRGGAWAAGEVATYLAGNASRVRRKWQARTKRVSVAIDMMQEK